MFVKNFSQAVKKECSAKETLWIKTKFLFPILEETFKLNTKWKKDYIKQGYKLMSIENIYINVIKLLNK